MPYDPMELPAPPGLFAPGGMPIPTTQVDLPKVDDPVYLLQQMQKQPMQVPDVVGLQYRMGDKNVVADLLRIVNGEQPQTLSNIPSSYALKMLQGAGMPTTMDAWTGDQWKAAIDAQAQLANPMAMLGGY